MRAGSTAPAAGEGELRERLAAIVESSDDAIIGKTLDGVITTWNAGATRMYGYTADEMIGASISRLLPPDRADELEHILARLRAGGRIDHYETKRVRKDGAVIDVSVSVSPVQDVAGVVVGAATVSRDVTERRRVEAARQAMARLETVGQLAGGLAHHFNNQLGIILGYAGLVARGVGDRPDVLADVQPIREAAERAALLTRQLLISSRRDLIRPAVIDLNEVIAGVRELITAAVGGDVRLRFEPAAALPSVLADPGQLELALLSLVVNAAYATPPGGSVTIATSLADLGAAHAGVPGDVRPGRYVEFTVSDTGTGMTPDVAARIFEPFYTTKPPGQGTGLGLSTVREVVQQAGGAVSVDSAEGSGTVFHVYLPARGAPDRAEPAGAAPARAGIGVWPAGPQQGEAILIVDDEPAMLAATARMLREHGYSTFEASSGEQALSLASGHDVRLLLTACVIRRMSGAELAARVHQLRPAVRVVYMSGDGATVLDPQRGAGPPLALLRKPFTAQSLIDLVRTALDAPAAGSELA